MKKRGNRRKVTGVVISNKMDKTVIIVMERIVKHPLYKKYIKRRSKFAAHDKNNECQIGDTVLIIECRPLSKTKRWQVLEILKKAV